MSTGVRFAMRSVGSRDRGTRDRGTRATRPVAIASTLLFVCSSFVAVIAAGPAGASSPPGQAGAPVAVGMPAAAALRWNAPGDVGTPPLTRYDVETNDGSGWSAAPNGQRADAFAEGTFHTCGILDDGTVKCWGQNTSGQLGLGDTVDRGDNPNEMAGNLPPVALGTGRSAVALAAGDLHSCALLDDGTVKCWGENSSGQLGLGNTADRGDGAGEMGDNLATVALGTGRTAVAIAAGDVHTCALLDDASVKCWGGNSTGQLGLGNTTNKGDNAGEMGDSLPAVALGTGRTATALSSNFDHLRAARQRKREVLGQQRAGAAGIGRHREPRRQCERDGRQPPGRVVGNGSHRDRGRRRWRLHVCGARQQHGEVLGRQLRGTAGDREHPAAR